jgi:sugar fermentation stimulation protein A
LPGTWEIGETPQGRLFCVNTARANGLVEEALRAGVITELNGFTGLKREVAYGQENSRIDFRLDYPDGPAYVEVKSVTLGFDGTAVAAFPDAVTQRGAKHLRELAHLAREGIRAVQLYCVCLTDIEAVRPAQEIDAAYAQALREAVACGVEVLAYGVRLSHEEMLIDRRLDVLPGG